MPPRKFEFPVIEDDDMDEVKTAEEQAELEKLVEELSTSPEPEPEPPTIAINVDPAPSIEVPAGDPPLSAKTLAEMEAGRKRLEYYASRAAANDEGE